MSQFRALLPSWVPDRIHLVGTGSSMNAMLSAVGCLSSLDAQVSLSSPMEFLRISDPVHSKYVLAFVVSQSGESIDSITAARHLLDAGAHVIGVTADTDSPLAKLGIPIAHLLVSDELIGPKTKGYFATVLTLQLFGFLLSGKAITIDVDKFSKHLTEFIETASQWSSMHAPTLADSDVVLVLGQGSHYGNALEGALKIAEMSGVPCFGLETEEASHGRFHGLTKKSSVIFIVSTKVEMEFAQRCQRALQQFELTSYIFNMTSSGTTSSNFDITWSLASTFPIDALAGVIPFQLLAVDIAKARGIIPEKMRHPGMSSYLGIKVSTAQ